MISVWKFLHSQKIKFTKSDKPDFPASVENEIYKRQLFSIPCICGRWGARDLIVLISYTYERWKIQKTIIFDPLYLRKMGCTRSGGSRLCTDRSGAETLNLGSRDASASKTKRAHPNGWTLLILQMRKMGLEPTLGIPNMNLNHACLPIPALPHLFLFKTRLLL